MVRVSLWVTAIFLILFFIAACVAVGRQTKVTKPVEDDPSSTLPESAPVSGIASSQPVSADLPDLGAAPELSNQVWLNTSQPLRLADLRGKVVLIDMWTFG